MTKKQFVVNYLTPMLKALNDGIDYCDYLVTQYGSEYVEIVYLDGYRKRVNVTADSNYAIAIDVLRSGGF